METTANTKILWRVVDHGPRYDRQTRTWDYSDKLIADGIATQAEADAILRRAGHTAGASTYTI